MAYIPDCMAQELLQARAFKSKVQESASRGEDTISNGQWSDAERWSEMVTQKIGDSLLQRPPSAYVEAPEDVFRIDDIDGVKMIYGRLPLNFAASIMTSMEELWETPAIVDLNGLAQHYGAKLAVGPAEKCEALRERIRER